MKAGARWIKKAALGLVLIVAASFAATTIYNALAQQNPENALPIMEVYYNTDTGDRLPVDYIKRDEYTWNFLFWLHTGGGKDRDAWRNVRTAPVLPDTDMMLTFSIPPISVRMSVKVGDGDFEEIGGRLHTPTTPNLEHIYRVEANFGTNKTVVYYFRLAAQS